MALKTFKPTTPSQRQLVLVDRSHLWKGKPVKALTEGLTKSGGRNNHGRVSMWHRGGGHKRTYRKVDFKRGKLGVLATVERLDRRGVVLSDVAPDGGEVVLSLHHQPGFRAAPSLVLVGADRDAHDPIPMLRLTLPGPVSRLALSWENR